MSITAVAPIAESQGAEKRQAVVEAVAEHRAILDAVRHGGGSRAKAAMQYHLRKATQRI